MKKYEERLQEIKEELLMLEMKSFSKISIKKLPIEYITFIKKLPIER